MGGLSPGLILFFELTIVCVWGVCSWLLWPMIVWCLCFGDSFILLLFADFVIDVILRFVYLDI